MLWKPLDSRINEKKYSKCKYRKIKTTANSTIQSN